jgi:hypothetical protein
MEVCFVLIMNRLSDLCAVRPTARGGESFIYTMIFKVMKLDCHDKEIPKRKMKKA